MAPTTPRATKIMIIRHAEKPAENPQPDTPPSYGVNEDGIGDGESLTVRGWQRAGALAVLFKPFRGPLQDNCLATPDFVYASKAVPHTDSDSLRPQQTVLPLVNLLNLDKDHKNFDFLKGEESAAAKSALACQGVVLICWEHKNIHKFVNHILKNQKKNVSIPKTWPDDCYDMVWIFDLDPSAGTYEFSQIAQFVLAGDQPIQS